MWPLRTKVKDRGTANCKFADKVTGVNKSIKKQNMYSKIQNPNKL